MIDVLIVWDFLQKKRRKKKTIFSQKTQSPKRCLTLIYTPIVLDATTRCECCLAEVYPVIAQKVKFL